jgi:hypothetical protein
VSDERIPRKAGQSKSHRIRWWRAAVETRYPAKLLSSPGQFLANGTFDPRGCRHAAIPPQIGVADEIVIQIRFRLSLIDGGHRDKCSVFMEATIEGTGRRQGRH